MHFTSHALGEAVSLPSWLNTSGMLYKTRLSWLCPSKGHCVCSSPRQAAPSSVVITGLSSAYCAPARTGQAHTSSLASHVLKARVLSPLNAETEAQRQGSDFPEATLVTTQGSNLDMSGSKACVFPSPHPHLEEKCT